MVAPLSWALQEQVVQVCGTAFWYKRPLRALLVKAGVPGPLVDKYDGLSKYVMVREILAELEAQGDQGRRVQKAIVRELASIRSITDSSVDRAVAQMAIRELQKAAIEEGVLRVKGKPAPGALERRQQTIARLDALSAQEAELKKLRERYNVLATRGDMAQERGYDLEELIGALLVLYAIPYKLPFRKGTVEQTDGFFTFDGFSYLIEARWRKSPPTLGQLGSFSKKVESKIESTRGLLVSVAGFRKEVIDEAKTIRNVIYMSGHDLALILEGHFTLPKALQIKADQAAQRGTFFDPLQGH